MLPSEGKRTCETDGQIEKLHGSKMRVKSSDVVCDLLTISISDTSSILWKSKSDLTSLTYCHHWPLREKQDAMKMKSSLQQNFCFKDHLLLSLFLHLATILLCWHTKEKRHRCLLHNTKERGFAQVQFTSHYRA